MDREAIKVSVVMTAYNLERFIKPAIDSVLNSSHKNIELVVVEDISTDNTLNIIKSYTDSRVVLIQNETNVGAGMSRRIGIEECTGDFIITIDGDDEITEDYIEALLNRQIETNADIVCSSITAFGSSGTVIAEKYDNIIEEGLDKFTRYFKDKYKFLNNKLVKRSLYATKEERLNNVQNKVVYSDRRYIEDVPTAIQLLYYANKIAYTDHTGYIYSLRDTSLTNTADKFKQSLYEALCACDVFKFFNSKEDEYQQFIPANTFIKNVKNARNLATKENINIHLDAWIELSLNIIDLLDGTTTTKE